MPKIFNAAGGWSSELFACIGIQIPVALEPVYAANFLVSACDIPENLPIIADFVNHQQLDHYLAKVQNRFPKIGRPVYAGGYRSFFDITPDLKFILGPDTQAKNLYHCLGAGQSLKYAPLFGELIAELITEKRVLNDSIAIEVFSIGRFADKAISDFWQNQHTDPNSL